MAGSSNRVTWLPVQEQYDHESSLGHKLQQLLLLNFAAFNRGEFHLLCCEGPCHSLEEVFNIYIYSQHSTWHVHKICKHVCETVGEVGQL
jgi:hypothetical protein